MISNQVFKVKNNLVIVDICFAPVDKDKKISKLSVDGDVHIKEGAYLTTNIACYGLYVHVKGVLKVDGTISMEGRGIGSTTRPNHVVDVKNQEIKEIPSYTENRINYLAYRGDQDNQFPNGGRGGKGTHGGITNHNNVGKGGKGWLFGGGSGGSGQGGWEAEYSDAAPGYSLAGGTGVQGDDKFGIGCSGGGAGNPYGSYGYHYYPHPRNFHGTGGFLFITAESIFISSTGNINSNGSQGKSSWNGTSYKGSQGSRGGGGGSGAGFVYIFYDKIFKNEGIISATGGSCGFNNGLNSPPADSTTPIIQNSRHFSKGILY